MDKEEFLEMWERSTISRGQLPELWEKLNEKLDAVIQLSLDWDCRWELRYMLEDLEEKMQGFISDLDNFEKEMQPAEEQR
jgi:hypothetical protein